VGMALASSLGGACHHGWLPARRRRGQSKAWCGEVLQVTRKAFACVGLETTRVSLDGNPTLNTSVVVPGGLPRAIPVSAMPKSIQKDKNSNVEYNIYFITLIRVHHFGTCRVQVHRD
jgi:hypothetical protein